MLGVDPISELRISHDFYLGRDGIGVLRYAERRISRRSGRRAYGVATRPCRGER